MASNNKKETQPANQAVLDLASADEIARIVDRPVPWVGSRLSEIDAKVTLRLNGVDYFDVSFVPRIQEIVNEWSERVRQAKREAAAIGE